MNDQIRARAARCRPLVAVLFIAGASRTQELYGRTHNTLNADLGLPGDAATKAVFEFLDGILKNRRPSFE